MMTTDTEPRHARTSDIANMRWLLQELERLLEYFREEPLMSRRLREEIGALKATLLAHEQHQQ